VTAAHRGQTAVRRATAPGTIPADTPTLVPDDGVGHQGSSLVPGSRDGQTSTMAIAPDLATLLRAVDDPATSVVAGHRLERQVATVRVLGPDAEPGPDAAGALLVGNADVVAAGGADLVVRAHAAGASGLVVADPRELPVDLLARANDLAFPVIVVRSSATPHDVALAVMDALVTHQRASNDALEDRFASITLEELVSADPHRTREAIERGSNLGWDLHRPRAVLLASIDPPVDPGVAHRVLPTIAAAARATLGDDAVVWTRATSVAALLAADDGTAARRRQLADALREELDQRVRSVTLSIGVGRCASDPTELPTSFLDANRAVDVGRWAKGRHVTELYDELGLERLFASVPQQDLHDFVLHAIGPLFEHDRRQRSELVATLSTWLQTRNIAEAARQMFVHYNTFKNRLERIEDILGPILADPGRLLECEVAIHVSRHYDGPWKDPAG